MEPPLEEVRDDALIGWCWISGNHQSVVISVSQINGDSDLVPTCTCRLGWGRSQERNNGAYQPFCPERAAPPALTVKPDNSVPSHTLLVVFKLLSICWNFWCLYESKSVLGLFQRMPGSTAVLSHLSGIPADFHSQKLWGFLFLALVLWPEEPVWDWDPSLFKGTSTAEISP